MKQFRVEYMINRRKEACIFARQIGAFDFEILEDSRLGPVQLRQILNQPRAVKDDGSPDFEIFIFYPQSRSQLKEISIGDLLELIE